MKPVGIDFAPRRSPWRQPAWLASGAGLAMVMVLALSATSLLTAPVEASHMAEIRHPDLPGAEELVAIDAAVGVLNRPWLTVMDSLAASFGANTGALLLSVETDSRRETLRLTGEATHAETAQALPARLRSLPAVADAILIGVEPQESKAGHGVRFVLEVQWREAG